MFDKAEKEYNDLVGKKKIVEQDKAKIEQAIRELDVKKNEALVKAYDKVCNAVRIATIVAVYRIICSVNN
jgi:structural maintenance of chromosome 2